MTIDFSRRTILRGAINGIGVGLALPILDIALNGSGTAFAATGAALPVRFGTWLWGLGVNPQHWFPDKAGPNYVLKEESKILEPFQKKLNILGNFNMPLD